MDDVYTPIPGKLAFELMREGRGELKQGQIRDLPKPRLLNIGPIRRLGRGMVEPSHPDQKPKDYRHFRDLKDPRKLVNNVPVRWQNQGGHGIGQIGETCNEQQEAQHAWDETRSNDKEPERK